MSLVMKLFPSKFLLIQLSKKTVAKKKNNPRNQAATQLFHPLEAYKYFTESYFCMWYGLLYYAMLLFFFFLQLFLLKILNWFNCMYTKSDILSCGSLSTRKEVSRFCPTFPHVNQWPPQLHLGQGARSWLHHLYSLALFFGQCA